MNTCTPRPSTADEAPALAAKGPLAGVRILDLTHALAGSVSTMLLAQMGADVIKVERPGGDQLRALEVDGFHPFDVVNEAKRSIVVDLREQEGADLLRSLLGSVEVLVENFRPGVLARFGLGYGQVAGQHPHLVYCSISGFGREELAEWPGFDLAAQAMSGLLGATLDPDGTPRGAGAPVASMSAGILAATGILAAYTGRLRTGQGQRVTTSVLDAANALMLLNAARVASRGGLPPEPPVEKPLQLPGRAFPTADGWFVLTVEDDRAWQRACAVIQRPDLAQEPRYATTENRRTNHLRLAADLASAFTDWRTAELVAQLQQARVPCAPVHEADSKLQAPFTFSSGAAAASSRVPGIGEHTRSVLTEMGVPTGRIDALLERGVLIDQAGP